MILLIAGASHTGKTLLAQRLLEKYHYPYLSIDHLKMGLIRSGTTDLTVFDDEKLTDYLWPIVREMIKTAIENGQNLIVEGCYIPFDWEKDFDGAYKGHIQYRCLILSEQYIRTHFSQIKDHANVIERRLDDSGLSREALIQENVRNLALCKKYGCPFILLEDDYEIDMDWAAEDTVSKFRPEDAGEVSALIAHTLRTTNIRDYSQDYIEAEVTQFTPEHVCYRASWTHFYVIRRGERIVACGAIGPYWGKEDESSLFNIFVHPDCQGKGLGRKLIETLEQDEYFLRAKRVEIPASITACGFYRKMGYDYKNGVDTPDREGLLRLEKYKEIPL